MVKKKSKYLVTALAAALVGIPLVTKRSWSSRITRFFIPKYTTKPILEDPRLFAVLKRFLLDKGSIPFRTPRSRYIHYSLDIFKGNLELTIYPGLKLKRRGELSRADTAENEKTIGESVTATRNPAAPLLYIHGGGYVEQPTEYHYRFLWRLATALKRPVKLFVYPKVPDEVAVDVISKTSEWLEAQERSTVLGDSSGGGLIMSVMEVTQYEPLALVLISPWLDVSMTNPDIVLNESHDATLSRAGLLEIAKLYAGDLDLSDPLVSPINYPFKKLPKMAIYIGTNDMFLADVRKFAHLIKTVTPALHYVEAPYMEHVYPILPTIEGEAAVRDIIRYTKEIFYT